MPGLGTEDHPADVHLIDVVDYLVDYIERRNLANVVLVGHSWGAKALAATFIHAAN